MAASASAATTTLHTAKGDLVTGDAAAFVRSLQDSGADGQIVVWLKETDTPRPTPQYLLNLPGSAPETIALATDAPGMRHRATLGPASVHRASADAVVRMLSNAGALDVRRMDALPALTLRLPAQIRNAAVQLLLHNPNVDYVSAARAHPVKLLAGPLGTNPIDTKHTVHRVPEAWNLTRGEGARIGVLDSGFAREAYTGAFHDDGQNFGSYGIVPLGFVDDGCNSSTANDGGCTPYDDQWAANGNYAHGTAAAGIIGENDNNIGYVGIAPMATTYSMKIAWNTHVQGHCGDNPFNEDYYCIEDDDFVRAVDYAAYHQFNVLSMSFGGDFGSDVYRALATARNTYGVLPLAATGNTVGGAAEEPASYDVVMGVGGVDAAGNNMYSTAARDVSGYTDGASLAAVCYQNAYCDAGSPGRLGSLGGTSAATAIVAGIAGLVHAYHPNETPDQIWERLVNSAVGPNLMVDAYAALTYPRPLAVSIWGPPALSAMEYGTWKALETGGAGPYSYTWSRDGYVVGTGKFYSGYSDGNGFTLQVDVTDAQGATATAWTFIGTVDPQCPDPEQICEPT